jgi:hypothetical protein
VRDNDVFVTEDENIVPAKTKFPAVGIKDGPVTRQRLPGNSLIITLNVRLIIWVQLMKGQATILGNAATGDKGVLEIEEDIHTALDGNLLSISGMQDAFAVPDTGSELAGDEQDALQRKVVEYEYIKEV